MADDIMKYTRALDDVSKNLLIFNTMLQVSDQTFLEERGGVAIPYIVSAPGAGKTSSLVSLCKSINWGLISVHLAMKSLEEMSGIPDFKNINVNGREYPGTVWSIPQLISELIVMGSQAEGVILCFDDIHLCGSQYLSLMQEFFTERSIKGYKIPDNVAIVLMGNASNKAGAKTQSSAIINRCCMLPVHTSFDSWKRNFALGTSTAGMTLPYDMTKLRQVAQQVGRVHPAIVSFLGHDNHAALFHEEEVVELPWASPRSWTRFSNWLTAYEYVTGRMMSDDKLLYLGHGHIGKEAASKFVKFYKVFTKFDLDKILDMADTYELPESMTDRYALAFALSSNYCGRKDYKAISDNYAQIVLQYIDNFPDLALTSIREILDSEKITGKKDLFMSLSMSLNKYRRGVTATLLKDIKNV